MKSFLIIGMGSFGHHLCRKLCEQKCEIMIVDEKAEALEDMLPYVVSAKVGDCTNAEILKSFGIHHFDTCFVCVGSRFQDSLEITSLLKELGAKKVLSKAEEDLQAKFLLRNGADEVVYPEKQVANWASIRYTADHIRDYIEVDDSHAIFEVEVPEGWIGKTVGELDIRRKYSINIMATKENGKINMAVSPETVLTDKITLLVLGAYKELQRCFRI